MSQVEPVAQDRFTIRQVAFFGRKPAEHLEMSPPDVAELRGLKILDAPSGPGIFSTETPARGPNVIGCTVAFSRPSYPRGNGGCTAVLPADRCGGRHRDSFHGCGPGPLAGVDCVRPDVGRG